MPSSAAWGISSREEDGLDRDRVRRGFFAARRFDDIPGRPGRGRSLHGVPRAAGLPEGAGEGPPGGAPHGDHQRVRAIGQRSHRLGPVREYAAGIGYLAVTVPR